ncbi:sugar-specific transcriptional regulator TrmB [Methanosarcina sp. KYL-1]|uniref:sugar-specific transcriptional regulator TrmB n=1 Tax=Methanosarcina sp. KYL-1 TaxID=2602068 RepID=UPI0021010EBF|nr:sugar-specific transcriptional regulator TrmB [Methanosarcina sp. KYL-1]MCQ1535533.1 sugar-specific transcriptional regulator TrmB [Methanosarcina sp. KYL-1]
MPENSIDELIKWVISVDRRLILMESMKRHTAVRASDIAHESSRSTQNISRALKELEVMGLIECLTPEKTTWKKYILTDTGRKVLEKLEGKYL